MKRHFILLSQDSRVTKILVYGLPLIIFTVLTLVIFYLYQYQIQIEIGSILQESPQTSYSKITLALFIIGLLAFDILLPIPSSVVALGAVSILGFWLGGIVIFIGLCLSCILGYLAGFGYFKWITCYISSSDRQRASQLSKRLGDSALVLLRGVPVLAEASVLAAGIVVYPFQRFLLLTCMSNFGIAILYAYIGAEVLENGLFFNTVLAAVIFPCILFSCHLLFQYIEGKRKIRHRVEEKIDSRFRVDYQYSVVFEDKVFDKNNPCIIDILCRDKSQCPSCIVFIDEGFSLANPGFKQELKDYFDHHKNSVNLLSQPIVVSSGDDGKNEEQLRILYQTMLDHGLDRHCFVFAVGGGALLDKVGYACATFHRGVKLIRVPTTVLAQNDAGVGVKNGVNAFGYKNLLGSFAPPYAVLNDFHLLSSLGSRDKISGLAEAIKVALIKDKEFFLWLEKNADSLAKFEAAESRYAIRRCAELHMEKISLGGDPFESGKSRPLDYGHWSAHKLEMLSQNRIRHGEAVAVGLALDAIYAKNIGLLSSSDLTRILTLLKRIGFRLYYQELEIKSTNDELEVINGLEEFRQHLGGSLSIPMLCGIGDYLNVANVDIDKMQDALLSLAEFQYSAEHSMNLCSDKFLH